MKQIFTNAAVAVFLFITTFLLTSLSVNGQVITTIAGSSNRSYSGDGGPSNAAAINLDGFYLGLGPHTTATLYGTFCAVDDSDNIYFGDFTNHRIRKINA